MRKLFVFACILGMVQFAQAQYRSGGGGMDKWYFGGGFGLSIGTDHTSVSASPLVGYKITDPFSVGTSFTYQYVSTNTSFGKASYSNYGIAPFTRFQIDEYFAHAEFEYLNYEYATGVDSEGNLTTERDGYNALWLGGGYQENVGRNAGFFLLALYNVLYDPNELPQPYASPLSIRAGFAFGF